MKILDSNKTGDEERTIDKTVPKSIKEIKRIKSAEPPPDFDFDVIAEENNMQTIRRVQKFISDNPTHCDYLQDGSIYFGQKVG